LLEESAGWAEQKKFFAVDSAVPPPLSASPSPKLR